MITLTNPADHRIRAVFLKAHLKLMALGMKNSQISGKQMLAEASSITGEKYKRGEYTKARDALELKYPKTS